MLEPDEPVEGLKKIGEEITEILTYRSARQVRKPVIHYKYEKPDGEDVLIADLPPRPLEKGIAEASLLAHILVSKFVDHLSYYHRVEMFKRDFHWHLVKSTLNDWVAACCTLLWPLYEALRKEMLAYDYLQTDESPINVLDNDKKGETHQGLYVGVPFCGIGLVYLHYRKGQGQCDPKEMLADFEGDLQNDGYQLYDKVC